MPPGFTAQLAKFNHAKLSSACTAANHETGHARSPIEPAMPTSSFPRLDFAKTPEILSMATFLSIMAWPADSGSHFIYMVPRIRGSGCGAQRFEQHLDIHPILAAIDAKLSEYRLVSFSQAAWQPSSRRTRPNTLPAKLLDRCLSSHNWVAGAHDAVQVMEWKVS